MNLKPFNFNRLESLQDALLAIRNIARERTRDVAAFKNLDKVFQIGRTVGRVPSSSSDVLPTDSLWDRSYNPADNYLYILVNNGSSDEWRRVQLQGF